MFSDETVKRFWSKIDVRGPDECWEWQAGKATGGYGMFGVGYDTARSHRVAWMIANGQKIPDGLVVRHTCDNPPCCNPAHLLLGTQAENVADRESRGHGNRVSQNGSKNGFAKLTEADVVKIKNLLTLGRSQREIGALFNVAGSTIGHIATGRNWAWLEDEE